MSKLAELIAKEEGFGIPGTIPTRRNNPGDLRHCPHCSHEGIGPDDIGTIDTIEHGWEDLERQLGLYADKQYSLQVAINQYAPPSENDSARYLTNICIGLGMTPDMPVSEALKL
jgi:hypothetical protein